VPAHVPFTVKSNSENYVKPLIFDEVTEKNKLAPLLIMAHGVENSP